MGFVLVGVFAGTSLALQGAILQILCHGVSTGALFILVGALQERTHTRDIARLGGLWATVPRMGGSTMFFGLGAMGLPGLGNFVAEFLVLLGTYRVSPVATALASIGLIISTVYALWMIQGAFQGREREAVRIHDLGPREMAMATALVAALVWLGLYPQPVVDTAAPTVTSLTTMASTRAAER
jgi:NADH-quinone oxidoreductase subunit M